MTEEEMQDVVDLFEEALWDRNGLGRIWTRPTRYNLKAVAMEMVNDGACPVRTQRVLDCAMAYAMTKTATPTTKENQ